MRGESMIFELFYKKHVQMLHSFNLTAEKDISGKVILKQIFMKK